MSLIFYYAPMSTASVTEAVLAELGTPCERVKLDISAGETRTPEFLKVNPNGRVPTIVHDGTPIWESAAITMYLGEVFGVDAGLYPAPGARRGEAMKWIAWSSATLAEAASRLSAALPTGSAGAVETGSADLAPPDDRAADVLTKARTDIAARLGVLDGALKGKPFLLGDYSLADAHLCVFVGWIASMGIDLTPFPDVAGWMDRCATRPALAKLLAA